MTSVDFFNDLIIQFPSIKADIFDSDPELIHIPHGKICRL